MDRPVTQPAAAMTPRKLRILATTDLHMHLTAHNFVTDQTTQNPGLAGIATLIAQARDEARAQHAGCVLFDNGDLLQGTPMGDWLAEQPVSAQHPAIACLHALGYDAMGIGNHDLDYGLPYLQDVATCLRLPMVASNLKTQLLGPLQPAALIPCHIPATAQAPEHVLQVGVLSVLPQQTAQWNHHVLDGIAAIDRACDSLRDAVPALRAQGADLIVVLAHMGLDKNNDADDTALPLAQIPGIDAMIAGHTHRRFPGPDHDEAEGVNNTDSTVAKVPVVMPGHAGSDLAVLDLLVAQNGDGAWQVTHHMSELRRNTAQTPTAPSVLSATSPAETALRSYLSESVGEAAQDIQNFFGLAQPTAICALSAQAKAHIARSEMEGMAEAALPLVIATSAHTAGGRDGPDNFLCIPKGPVLRRHLSGLNPFGNHIWAVRVSGAQIKERLEHSATIYAQLRDDAPSQMLHNPLVPMFNFDTYFGLDYGIDPMAPLGVRIKDLRYGSAPVTPTQQFVLITNQFRAAGGGGYAPLPSDRVILRSARHLEDGLKAVFADQTTSAWDHFPWRLTPSRPVSATLETSPDALQQLHQIAPFSPHVGPTNAKGFVELRLTF
jgi:2',3'-cyclic-nucleotide 2'-phosphodiesterase/3'-nucleotidase